MGAEVVEYIFHSGSLAEADIQGYWDFAGEHRVSHISLDSETIISFPARYHRGNTGN